jgi:hypothetical protein
MLWKARKGQAVSFIFVVLIFAFITRSFNVRRIEDDFDVKMTVVPGSVTIRGGNVVAAFAAVER